MIYLYECKQGECDKCNVTVEIDKPMAECSKPEMCEECANELQRVYTTFAMRNGDGFSA